MRNENKEAEITGFAKKDMSPVMLHAAAFCSDIGCVILIEPYSSYMSIAMSRLYDPGFIMSAVPGALRKYDLPDLAASLAPRRLVIINPVDAEGKTSDTDIINKDLAVVKAGYRYKSADGNLKILTGFNMVGQVNQLTDLILNNNK